MFKIQFTATVLNPDTDEEFNGWVDMTHPFELREADTDVPVHTFYEREEALKFIRYNIGSIGQEQRGTFYADDTQMNNETGENWNYAANITEA